jgi:hypothetical protein
MSRDVKIFIFGGLVGAFIWNAITKSYMKGVMVTYEAMLKREGSSVKKES